MMGLKHLAGGVVGGAVAVKFIPTPFVVVALVCALLYAAARLALCVARRTAEWVSDLEWPDLGFCVNRRAKLTPDRRPMLTPVVGRTGVITAAELVGVARPR